MGYIKACRVCRYIQTDRKTDTKTNDKAKQQTDAEIKNFSK